MMNNNDESGASTASQVWYRFIPPRGDGGWGGGGREACRLPRQPLKGSLLLV